MKPLIRSIIPCVGALIALVIASGPAAAQTPATTRVTAPTVIREQPRGDSQRVVSVAPGEVLEVHGQDGPWYLVSPPVPPGTQPKWERGWIHASFIEQPTGAAFQPPARPRGRLMIRGFGQTGGTLFTADDSFDTILGSPFGFVFGGGAQVVFPNAVFVQVGFEHFRETGTRALVSGTQLFTLETPATIQVQPVTVTVGYRSPGYGRLAPYLGAGAGWHVLKEESPGVSASDTREGTIGYHVLGGVEFAVARWVALAGEVQWAGVPKGIGESGISLAFEEDDLGGTTFRFKFIVGR
jgi:opacity protein-like surface antigen